MEQLRCHCLNLRPKPQPYPARKPRYHPICRQGRFYRDTKAQRLDCACFASEPFWCEGPHVGAALLESLKLVAPSGPSHLKSHRVCDAGICLRGPPSRTGLHDFVIKTTNADALTDAHRHSLSLSFSPSFVFSLSLSLPLCPSHTHTHARARICTQASRDRDTRTNTCTHTTILARPHGCTNMHAWILPSSRFDLRPN